jgi:hypothetical protein|tara:strand:- start:989 stop:1165 length:177 start_codon:yes stop_codon:yes gene_type:complete
MDEKVSRRTTLDAKATLSQGRSCVASSYEVHIVACPGQYASEIATNGSNSENSNAQNV